MGKLLIKALLALSIVLVFPAQAMPNVPNKSVTAKKPKKPDWYKPKNYTNTKKHGAKNHLISDAHMKKLLSDLASTNNKRKRQRILAKTFNKHANLKLTSKDIDLSKASLRIKANNESASLIAIGAALITVTAFTFALFSKSLALSGISAVLTGGAVAAIDIALDGELDSFIAVGVGTIVGFFAAPALILGSGTVVSICLLDNVSCVFADSANIIQQPKNSALANHDPETLRKAIKDVSKLDKVWSPVKPNKTFL